MGYDSKYYLKAQAWIFFESTVELPTPLRDKQGWTASHSLC
jgi:hypothetical protein